MSITDISDPGHGHSPAAWTAVIIMIVGFAVGVFSFWFDSIPLFGVAAALVVIGPITGWILAKAGWGVAGPKYQPNKSH